MSEGVAHALRTAVQPAASEAAQGSPQSVGRTAAEEACRTVYFARVPPCVPEWEIYHLFSQCGAIKCLQLFRPWSKARSSKGCGLIVYATPEAAQAALAQLNGTHHWPEAFSPLLVERRDAAKGNGRTQKAKGPARCQPAQGQAFATSADRFGRCKSPFAIDGMYATDAEYEITHSSSSNATSSASDASSGGPRQLQVHTLDVLPMTQGMGCDTAPLWSTVLPAGMLCSATQGTVAGAQTMSAQQQQQQQLEMEMEQWQLFEGAASAQPAASTSAGCMQPVHATLQLSALTLCEAVNNGGSLAPGSATAPMAAPLGATSAAGDPSFVGVEGGSSGAPAAALLPLFPASSGAPLALVSLPPASSAVGLGSQGMPTAASAMLAQLPPSATSAPADQVPVHLVEDWPLASPLLGQVPMPCQHRMLLKLTHPQANVVRVHAEVLGRVTGTDVSFTVSTDGAPVLCIEGSSAQVIQAQSLVLLLL